MSNKFETIFLDNLPTREIAERIRKGEIVYLAPGVEYPHIRYEANCLVLYRGAYPQDRVLNTALDLGCPGAYRPYFKEELPMRMEVGKFYRSRRNTKYFCFAKTDAKHYPFRCVEIGTTRGVETVNEQGKTYTDKTHNIGRTLLEEWEDE